MGENWRGNVVEPAGNVYVAGNTTSTDFPTTPGSFQTTSGGGTAAFVAKLNPSGAALVYSTYIVGAGEPEDLAVDSRDQAGEHNRLGAVVHVCEGHEVRAADLDEEPKGIDTDPAAQLLLAGAEHGAGPQNHERKPALAIGPDDFLLLQLAKSIRVTPLLGRILQGTALVNEGDSLRLEVGIHGKRTDIHEPLRMTELQEALNEVAGRQRGVEKGAGKRLLHPGGEMIDDGHTACRRCACVR